MEYIINNDELAHYGVPGMKWGVRKSEYKAMSRGQRKALRKAKRQEYKAMRQHRTALLDKAERAYDTRTGNSYQRAKQQYRDSRDIDRLLNQNLPGNSSLSGLAKTYSSYNTSRRRDQYSRESAAREISTGNTVAKQMTKKYGDKKMAEFNAYEAKRGAAVAGAALAAGIGAMAISSAVSRPGARYTQKKLTPW